jgi:RimJ/RimL family protein N-acetyltransferase
MLQICSRLRSQRPSVRGDRKNDVAEFVLKRTMGRTYRLTDFQALGAYDGDTLLGGFLYTNYRTIGETGFHSIDMHMAGEPGWLTRRTLAAFFGYPFLELGCSRVVGSIGSDNKHARDIAERFGLKLDGTIRSGIGSVHDTCVYTMTRAECPWI